MSKYVIFLILILIVVLGAGCVTPKPDNNTTPPSPSPQNITVFTAEEVTEEQFNKTNFSEEGKFVYFKGEGEGFANQTVPIKYLKGKVPIESLPIIVRTSDGQEDVEINSVTDNPNYPSSSKSNKIVEGAAHSKATNVSSKYVNITFENDNYDVVGSVGPITVDNQFREEFLSKGDIHHLRVEMQFYYGEFATSKS
jgi:hypothetical protein